MASASPRPVLIRPCRYGTQLMEAMSTRITGMLVGCYQWRGHLIASASPRPVMTRPCKCGTQPMEVMSIHIVSMLVKYTRWHGHPIASASPRVVTKIQCRCGSHPNHLTGYYYCFISFDSCGSTSQLAETAF